MSPSSSSCSTSCRRHERCVRGTFRRLPFPSCVLMVVVMMASKTTTTTGFVQALPSHPHRSARSAAKIKAAQWQQAGRRHDCPFERKGRNIVERSSATMTMKRFKTRLPGSFPPFLSSRQSLRGGGYVVSPSTCSRNRLVLSVAAGGSSNPSSTNDDKNNDGGNDESSITQGRLLLLLVALLYGTLNVTLRFVYNTPMPDGAPISASALSAVRGWMATLCFVPLWLVYKKPNPQEPTTTTTSSTIATSDSSPPPAVPVLWKAALELAVWNFGAQGLLSIGLLTTGSARAAFLTQLSVVLTPLISLVAGQVIPSTVWYASLLALAGLVLLSGGGTAIAALFGTTASSATATITTAGAAATAASFGAGDLYVLAGALCWSLYLFRLSGIGYRFNDIELQASKTIILAILYTIWFVWGGLASGTAFVTSITSGGWLSYISAINPLIGIFLLYSALGPGTIADVIQTQGQAKVSSASEANVILSMEPVFAALCAFFVLGEVTTLPETVGGGLILLAALLATRQEKSK